MSVEFDLKDKIREAYKGDAFVAELREARLKGIKMAYIEREGLIWYKQRRLYVPKGPLRKEVLSEHHDIPLAGHGGIAKTLYAVKWSFHWSGVTEDVTSYVNACPVCQQAMVELKAPAGLLQSLPMPLCPWLSVTMDFIIPLPISQGFDAIMVVVDRFSKMVHFTR